MPFRPVHLERNKHMIIKFRFLMLYKKICNKFCANLALKFKNLNLKAETAPFRNELSEQL